MYKKKRCKSYISSPQTDLRVFIGVLVGVSVIVGGLLDGLGARGPQVDGEVDELRVLLHERADRVRLQVVGRLLLQVQPAGAECEGAVQTGYSVIKFKQ